MAHRQTTPPTGGDPNWYWTGREWLWWNGQAWLPGLVPPSSPAKTRWSTKRKIVTWSCVAAAIVLVTVVAVTTPKSSHALDFTAEDAKFACEDMFVPPYLKSGHADHYAPEYTYDSSRSASEVRWTIRGTVYATNSFNAVVPAPYSCQISDDSQGDVRPLSVTVG